MLSRTPRRLPRCPSGTPPRSAYPYDPKRAQALLAEAGWKDTNGDGILDKGGEMLALQLLFPAKHYGQGFDETTPAVAEMLKAVGVKVEIKPVDFATLLQTVTKGDAAWNGGFTACRTSNNLDADDYVRDWASVTLINWAPFPPELAELYKATRREARRQEAARAPRRPPEEGPRLDAGHSALPGDQDLRAEPRVVGFQALSELHMDLRPVGLRK